MKNCSFAFISNLVKDLIQKLHFTDDELAEIEARSSTDISLLEEKRNSEIEQLERSRKRIREELAYLRSNRLQLLKSGVYQPDEFCAEQNKLERGYDELC